MRRQWEASPNELQAELAPSELRAEFPPSQLLAELAQIKLRTQHVLLVCCTTCQASSCRMPSRPTPGVGLAVNSRSQVVLAGCKG